MGMHLNPPTHHGVVSLRHSHDGIVNASRFRPLVFPLFACSYPPHHGEISLRHSHDGVVNDCSSRPTLRTFIPNQPTMVSYPSGIAMMVS